MRSGCSPHLLQKPNLLIMSQHKHLPSSSGNGNTNPPTQGLALLPISTISCNTTSRASRIPNHRSAIHVSPPVTPRGDLQSATSASAGSSHAPTPRKMYFTRTGSLIRGLISHSQDGADLHRRYIQTARLTAARQTLLYHQLNPI